MRGETMSSPKGLPPMTRGLGQVLFNYLPEATLDYERGSCICKVAEVRISTESAQGIDRMRILDDIRDYVARWDDHSDLKMEHTRRPGLFAFGEPENILFNIYPLVFECRKCRAAFSFQSEVDFLKNQRNYKCRWCGGRLGQLYHVLVHQCGDMKQLWVPRCENPIHTDKETPVKLDFRGSQKAMDFRWKCMACGVAINRPIYRRCEYCSGKTEGRAGSDRNSRMRPIPHRANAAYYTHHITKVNISRDDVQQLQEHPDKEHILVQAYLDGFYKTEDLLRGIIKVEEPISISDQMRRKAQTMPDGPQKKKMQSMADAMAAMEVDELESDPENEVRYGLTAETLEELFDYVKMRGTCRVTELADVKREADLKRPGMGRVFDSIRKEHQAAGISEISLVEDFPVVTAVFGYTRVSAEPELQMGDRTIKTTFRHFPTFRMSTEKLQDKIPIFTRVSETEGLLVNLDPIRLLTWLQIRQPGLINKIPSEEKEAKVWLLRNVGDVDRFVTGEGLTDTTRLVFGLIHTLSHMFVRAAAGLAGVDRTGFSEYLFPRLGSFVVYNANTEFNLGGITTLYEEGLDVLLRNVRYDPLAKECIYDPVCWDKLNGSCHACTHLGEMACSFFNRGMRRDYLFGTQGFWGI